MSKKESSVNLKKIIKTAMDENGGKIEVSEAMELIRPHYEYDAKKLIEAALANRARQIIYSLRDPKGIRDVFANDRGIYYDTLTLYDEGEREKIKKQLKEKIRGLMKVWHKIRRQEREIIGQITFDELDGFMREEAS